MMKKLLEVQEAAFRGKLVKWAQEAAPVNFQQAVNDLANQSQQLQGQEAQSQTQAQALNTVKQVGSNAWNLSLGPAFYKAVEPLLSRLNVRNPFPM
jgi:hypothetical protein